MGISWGVTRDVQEYRMDAAIYELIGTAEFVVNAEGEKKAVMLDFSVWEDLLNLLEDIEDSAETESIRASGEVPVSWGKVKAELRAGGIGV